MSGVFTGLIRTVAQELLGDPNPRHSSSREWRYGTNGSLSVDLDRDVWKDHEADTGGGVLSLIERQTGCKSGEAFHWLVERNLIADEPRREITYDYVSAAGELLYQVVRKPGHEFRQRRPDGRGGWVWEIRGTQRVLYRLPQLLASTDTVYLVEGEKDADNLAALGLTATTSGAAKSWRHHFAEHFKGRDVVILPDNDNDGRDYAASAEASLRGVAASVRVVELPGLPRKGDVSDWLADGGSLERLKELCVAQPPSDSDGPLRIVSLANVMSANEEAWPHVMDHYLPRRVVTLLGGHGGVGKTMLALTFAAHGAAGRPWGPLHVERSRVVFLSFEDEGEVVRKRLRRIIEAYALPAAEVVANLAVFDGSDAQTELALDSVDGRGLDFTPLMGLVSEVVRGADLVMIDNASDTYGGNENERRQVRAFIRRLAREAKANDAAVVLLAHVDKQAAKGGGKGNNYSGSTQWHNGVRSRLALLKTDAGIELLHEKASYGPEHEVVSLQRVEYGVLMPVPAATAQAAHAAAQALTAQADAQAVLAVFEALIANNVDIPTASTGQNTSYHVLSRAHEMPQTYRGAPGKERVKAAILALERAGRICRETYKRDSKERERWALAEMPAREAA